MTHTQLPPNHTWWYKLKHNVLPYWWVTMGLVGLYLSVDYLTIVLQRRQDWVDAGRISKIDHIVRIEVSNTYIFEPTDEIRYKKISGVGLTYYSRGDGFTPGKTTRSGRFVGDGTIAVSEPLWNKEVMPGDFIWVKATNRWYKVEDTMHSKYTEPRVDIYTHDMKLANSGASKTDIIIMRQPK